MDQPSAETNPAESEQAPATQVEPAAPLPPVDQVPAAVSAPNADNAQKDCDESCQNYRDLVAQESMAGAAWTMVWVSLVSVLLGVVSLYLIWRTVQYTRVAARAGQDAVKEAKAASDIAWAAEISTRETAASQVRAYLGTTRLETQMYVSPEGSVRVWAQVAIVNGGQTPARSISYRIALSWQMVEGFKNATVAAKQSSEPADLMAGGDRIIFSEGVDLSEAEAAALIEHRMYFILKGRVRYRPVVGDKVRHLHFVYRLDRDGENHAFKMSRASHGNYAD